MTTELVTNTSLIAKEQRETLEQFFTTIHIATMEGREWAETSDEIINHFNKGGLGKAGFFVFKNIKVCPYGQAEKIQEMLDVQLGQLVHGDGEGKVNLGKSTHPNV